MDYANFNTCGGILKHPRDMTRQEVKDALYMRISTYLTNKRFGSKARVARERQAALSFLRAWRGL